MCSTIFILSAICFAFSQIIPMNIARSESSIPQNHSILHEVPTKSERSKHSLHREVPDRLQIRMKYPTGEEIDLKWVKIDQYLANKHLPVITSSDYLETNVMESIGDFVLYHDVAKCSAVVYFKKSHTIFGVIGLDHIISDLPYKFDDSGHYPGIVEEPHLIKRSNSPIRNDDPISSAEDPEDSFDSSPCGAVRNRKRQSDIDSGPNRKHIRKTRSIHRKLMRKVLRAFLPFTKKPHVDMNPEFCLEVLVFVTNDVAEFFKVLYGPDIYTEWIVKYFILYFNAVDMIFGKVRTTELGLRINIAKIVIEDSSKPFEFLNDGELQFSETVVKLREYLQTNQYLYTPDSFDHVFISTRRTIMDQSTNTIVGITEYGEDLYTAKEQDQFYNAVPITIVGFLNNYSIGTREISRTFDIETSTLTDGMDATERCSSDIEENDDTCDTCVIWTNSSKVAFETFFRTNRNRCFLLNEPRSTRPPGPSKYLAPSKQCECFGYQTYISEIGKTQEDVNPSECNEPLQCSKLDGDQTSCDYALRPFDGTACGFEKVCWNQKCVKYLQRGCPRKRKLFAKLL